MSKHFLSDGRVIERWIKDSEEETGMEDLHRPFWVTMIDSIRERSLESEVVLDFGCSTGGFLRTLHRRRPFARGVGIDVSREAVIEANMRRGDLPIDYLATGDLTPFHDAIDVAFSYEVIFLLSDLAKHAAAIYATLRSGGVYYVATGCHTDSPLWDAWKPLVASTTNLHGKDYSLDEITDTFTAAGFHVGARRLRHEGFVDVRRYPEYFPRIADALDYYSRDIVVFRFAKP